jgi:hypothetical protein
MFLKNLTFSLIFLSSIMASAASLCGNVLLAAMPNVMGRFTSERHNPQQVNLITEFFETHLREMLATLNPEQRQLAIEKITSFRFDNIPQMGWYDIQANEILLRSGLRGRLFGVISLLHEIRHLLDYNFIELPKSELVRKLETRAFEVEYRFIRRLLSEPQAIETLAALIAVDAKLSTDERFFLEYILRNSHKIYDIQTRRFTLGHLSPPEQKVATSTFQKFDKITLHHLQMLFQAAKMTEQGYIDRQLGSPGYTK